MVPWRTDSTNKKTLKQVWMGLLVEHVYVCNPVTQDAQSPWLTHRAIIIIMLIGPILSRGSDRAVLGGDRRESSSSSICCQRICSAYKRTQ